MRNQFFTSLLFFLVLTLTACQGTTAVPPASDSPTPAIPVTASSPPLPTATMAEALVSAPGCTVVGSITPDPLENSPIPPVGEQDWTHGPSEAAVTLIEYGDFQ